MSSWKIGDVAVAKFHGYPLWPVKIIGEVKQASGQANSPFSATGRMIFKQSLPKASTTSN